MKDTSGKITLAILTLVVLFGLSEAGLRFAGYGRLLIYAPDPDLYWKPVPNQHVMEKVGREPVLVNSHGTRGPEFDAAKPEGSFRVLCLGDSRTFGWGLAEEDTYEAGLQRMLGREAPPNAGEDVINAGVNAWSYPQMLVYLRKYGLAYSPDVIVLDGANLWTTFGPDQPEAFRRSFRRRVILKNLLRRSAVYHYAVEVRLQKYYEKYRRKLIPADDRPDEKQAEAQEAEVLQGIQTTIESMADLARTNGIELLLLHIPREDEATSRRSRRIKAIMEDVAERHGCLLVDPSDAFAASPRPLFQEADPVHFNAEGSAIVAEQVFRAIRSTPRFESFREGRARRQRTRP